MRIQSPVQFVNHRLHLLLQSVSGKYGILDRQNKGEKIIELSKIFQVTTDYLLLDENSEKGSTAVILEEDKDKYYKKVKSFGLWQVIYIFVLALAIYLFLAGSSFPAEFTTWIWLTFVLLIASAVAINKVLKTKQRYLDKVIGLETPSDNDDSTKPGIT